MMKLLLYISLISFFRIGSIVSTDDDFDQQCQILQCNPLTEICRRHPRCQEQQGNQSLHCVYCASKHENNKNSTTTISSQLVQSSERRLLADHLPTLFPNTSLDSSSYDDYYEYDDAETSDKTELNEYNEYLEEYNEPSESVPEGPSKTIRKLGTCPKVVEAIGQCDGTPIIQPECRFDTDCPGDLKCCAAACGKRTCQMPVQVPISNCPSSFHCSLNCRLGYRVDSNGCLLCECQSCPSMDQCGKRCSAGYLKDLFNCDICECRDQCPPFACTIVCPDNVSYAQTETGCPLCQCAQSRSEATESTSLCQKDVHCPTGFRCVTDEHNVPMCRAVSPCPVKRCRTACGPSGYTKDENGCSTCTCQSKSEVQCSRVICRIFCPNGFKRDDNGCEYCACNECPLLECPKTCDKYEKDSKGCSTCQCEESEAQCQPMTCDSTCPNGFEHDENGCSLCSCNQCPPTQCRMFCTYGFRRNERGCEICECDWTPIRENIQCSDTIPCPGTRVCNMKLKLCEIVDSDRVNWFIYNFEVHNELLADRQVIETFKTGLIHNIATKYGLQVTQITVSNVAANGETSFQIMPFFDEDLEKFEKKMDQIDLDLNTHEFRAVLPAIVRATEDDQKSPSFFGQWKETWIRLTSGRRRFLTYTIFFLVTSITVLCAILVVNMLRRPVNYSNLSDSKSPIYDTPYQKAPTEEEHFPAVQAPDGTTYVIVPGDETSTGNDKRALV